MFPLSFHFAGVKINLECKICVTVKRGRRMHVSLEVSTRACVCVQVYAYLSFYLLSLLNLYFFLVCCLI